MSKEIIEGNKLIAEFMGAKINETGVRFPVGNPVTELENWHYAPLSMLKYRTSWDWLMPVVERINKIHDTESDEWPVAPLYGDFYDPYTFFDLRITESINSAYRHVTAFIQWYNQQKSKP